jgi:hypothetical protein
VLGAGDLGRLGDRPGKSAEVGLGGHAGFEASLSGAWLRGEVKRGTRGQQGEVSGV